MNYPFWDVAIGYGWLMAGIAIIHVFVSHFAIGGGLYLVVAETFARKNKDELKLTYLQGLSKFFVLTTLVFGALTGVGIWFIIGLLNPTATEMLIHNFVWGWATEWTFFVIEILAAIIYLYGWKTMSAANHIKIGWIYFFAAWMSLFVINGILSFMLTPGEWRVTGDFWDGFFNPTFWSSLTLRTGICIMLGGLYAILVASRQPDKDFKGRLVAYNAVWAIIGIVIVVPCLFWYWHSIPAEVTNVALESMPMPMLSWWWVYVSGIVLFLLIVLFGFLARRQANLVFAIVLLAVALVAFGSWEWFRESIRKPWIISGYMWGNGTELALADDYQSRSLLHFVKFRTGDDGKDLFLHSCRSCHTIDGYKPLRPAFDGTDQEFIARMVIGTHVMKGNMPPYLGPEKDASLLASHIYKQLDHRHLAEIYGLAGVDLGAKVYDIRCGKCHEFGGFNDKSESLLGLTDEDYNDLLDMAGDFAWEMPDFTGDEQERSALIEFLKLKSQEQVEGGR
ncbi:MAG: cytochrome ubiquinol oxidase subunit I [bacterium]